MADTPGQALLTRLAELRAAPEPLAALLVDFRAIEHGDDPRFSLTLDHYLESWLGKLRREVFRLPGPRLLILAPAEAGAALAAGAGALARVLRRHGFGEMRHARFDLADGLDALLAQLAPLAVGESGGAHGLKPAATDRVPSATLGELLEVERALHGADIESLLREETLWSFSDTDVALALLTELAVSLEELEGRLELSLRRDAWLRHEVFSLIDRGILRHVARDRWQDGRALAFDLHTASVLDDGFAALAREIPAETRRRLTVELACWEVGLSAERFQAAAERLGDLGFAVAVDHVPPPALATLDLGGVAVAYVKALSGEGEETAALLRAGVQRFGADRLALWRCDTPAALATGRIAGVRLFQGRAADQAARQGHQEPEAKGGRGGRTGQHGGDELFGDEGGGQREDKPRSGGLFARLFGRDA